jgi:hypothetical protein
MILRRKLNQREWALCAVFAAAILTLPLFRNVMLPTWREWASLRSRLHSQTAEHDRFVRNLSRKKVVDAEFARLDQQTWQTESDQMTLASWLRELEVMARLPGMNINNMKALPVKEERSYRVYRVRLSVSGKLPEVMKFVSETTNGQSVTGVEAFSLRGTQGPNAVECSLALRMIRLTSEKTPPSAVGEKKPRPAREGANGI